MSRASVASDAIANRGVARLKRILIWCVPLPVYRRLDGLPLVSFRRAGHQTNNEGSNLSLQASCLFWEMSQRWFSSQVTFALLIERARLSQSHISQVVLSSYSSTSSLTNNYDRINTKPRSVTAVQLEPIMETAWQTLRHLTSGSSDMDVSLFILALRPRTSTYGRHRPSLRYPAPKPVSFSFPWDWSGAPSPTHLTHAYLQESRYGSTR
ncbi:hypothetical protein V8E55_002709 [Tylopilus felleus]